MIRYLSNIGEIVSMTTLADAMPEAEEMDAEACYLGFEIDLKSEANKETIADVFEFAHLGSLIHILPPHSKTTEYVELIRTLPEDAARLGDILVATGALTRHELDDGLNAQQNSTSPTGLPAVGRNPGRSGFGNTGGGKRRRRQAGPDQGQQNQGKPISPRASGQA